MPVAESASRRPLPCQALFRDPQLLSRRLPAVWRPSALLWRQEWLCTTLTSASSASSIRRDRAHETIVSSASWSTDRHAPSPPRSEMLNQFDVAVVQHEYGLYGGTDGDEVLEILGGLDVPSIVIAHTILTHPTPHQRSVLNEVTALADQVVVMTEAARTRLCDGFDVDPAKVADHRPRSCHPRLACRARAFRAARHIDLGSHRTRARGSNGPLMRCGRCTISRCGPATWSQARPTPRCWPPTESPTGRTGWSRRSVTALRHRWFRRRLSRRRFADGLDSVEQGGRASLRLEGPGDVGRPRRRDRGRATGGGDRLPARHGVARQRCRHRRRPR